jgi:CheY-like chemotaxis protein
MPEMDGIEATRIIKEKSLHTPVIVLSIYSEYQAAALAAGADAFISKGESPEHVLEALAKATSNK